MPEMRARIFAISMVKDEADVIGRTIEHLLAQGVQRLVIADNLSTDNTRGILDSFPEVVIVDDLEVGYYQSAKMTRLARQAYELGAEWIIPFDADEFWYWPVGTLAEFFSLTSADIVYAQTFEQLGDRRATTPKYWPKVAFRASLTAQLAQGNHSVTGVDGTTGDGLQIREYQYRSLPQFIRKVRNGKAAYDATDMPYSEGSHWREYGAMSDDELGSVWAQMQQRSDLIHDPFLSLSRPLGAMTA